MFFEICSRLYLVENVKVFAHLLSGGDNAGSSLVLDLFYCIIFEFLIEYNQKTSLKMTAVTVLTALPNKN